MITLLQHLTLNLKFGKLHVVNWAQSNYPVEFLFSAAVQLESKDYQTPPTPLLFVPPLKNDVMYSPLQQVNILPFFDQSNQSETLEIRICSENSIDKNERTPKPKFCKASVIMQVQCV